MLFSLALLGFWYAPIGKTEREFASLKKQKLWSSCDSKHEGDRLFVLRLYNRIKPALDFFRERENSRIKKEFKFRMIEVTDTINKPSSYYWDDLEREVIEKKDFFHLRSWIYWANDIEQLLFWDRMRLGKKLISKKEGLFFVPSEAVQRLGKNQFQIRLNPGDFESAKEVFKKTIERYWSTPPYQLKVLWTNSDAKAYTLVFDPFAATNRVSREERKIYLTEKIADATLVHEIGHVLGFSDHYDVYWSEKKCKIVGSVFLQDLMSNSYFKHPLIGHWLILNRAYPLRGRGNKAEFSYKQSEVFLEH